MLNIVPGFGHEIGDHLVGHPGVDKVSFTGSGPTAKRMLKTGADSLKRFTFELGGKAPHILFADADLDQALNSATASAWTNCGQSCALGSRVLVERPVYDRVVEMFRARAATVRVGMPMGGSRLRNWADRNPALELRGTQYTHDPRILGRFRKFVALNSALEVDLTGQINSEVAGGRYVGAVGGIIDFLRAAGFSEGGQPIVALPSTARQASRIVPRLTGPVTVPRAESCVIVTEHGIADLRGLSLRQRAAKMIAIAHPGHREMLERAAQAQQALF